MESDFDLKTGLPFVATTYKGNSDNFRRANFGSTAVKVCDAAPRELLLAEIAKCGPSIYSRGEFELYLINGLESPLLMREIGREREIAFREIGEGTEKECDTDIYDSYYRQLIVWNSFNNRIVGGYRLGYGNEIMRQYGVDGFYTSTLFEFSGDFVSLLGSTIELGRAFVVKDYQKHPVILLMLWRGILSVILQNRDFACLFGPVSISNDYCEVSKSIIINFIKRFRLDYSMSLGIVPRNGIPKISMLETKHFTEPDTLDLLDRLVKEIEQDKGIPVLLKKYLQINGKVLAFNVDPLFKNSLDAFILLRLQDVPESMIELIGKDLNLPDIKARFK